MWSTSENLLRTLSAALTPAFGDTPPAVVTGPDGLIGWTDESGREVVAEIVMRPARTNFVESWRRVHAHAHAIDAIPVVVVPRLPRSLRELTAQEHMNWLDFAGNATVRHPLLRVHVEGRGPYRGRPRLGTDPFSLRNANVTRLLMADPGRAWRQKDLVGPAGLSQPQISKVLRALQEMALVLRAEDGSVQIDEPGGLLDAWADAYRYSRQLIVPAHLTGEGTELAREVHRRLGHIDCRHWFTGLPAAWAYDHFAGFRLVSVFVDDDPELVRDALGLREARRGANVHLVAVAGQRVDLGEGRPDDLPCVHPAQAYVDLLGLPERAEEAADHLRRLALSGPS